MLIALSQIYILISAEELPRLLFWISRSPWTRLLPKFSIFFQKFQDAYRLYIVDIPRSFGILVIILPCEMLVSAFVLEILHQQSSVTIYSVRPILLKVVISIDLPHHGWSSNVPCPNWNSSTDLVIAEHLGILSPYVSTPPLWISLVFSLSLWRFPWLPYDWFLSYPWFPGGRHTLQGPCLAERLHRPVLFFYVLFFRI